MSISGIESWLGPFIINRRWSILLFCLSALIISASGTQYLGFDNNSRVFFSKENPQLKAFEALENTYTKNEIVMFIVVPKNGNVFTKQTLAAVEELTNKSWQIPYSSRVHSITNFQRSRADGDILIVGDLVANASELTQGRINEVKNYALAEPLLLNRLISPTGAVTGVAVNVLKPGKSGEEVKEIVSYARNLKDAVETKYPNITIMLSGGITFNNAFMEVSMSDMSTLMPLMLLILLVVLGFMMRSVSGMFCTLTIIIASAATATGIGGWLGIKLSAPSVNAPTIILTLSVAHCIHFFTSLYMAANKGMSKHAAITESLRVNLQPIVVTSLTTAVGFISMNFSDAPPFRDLGNLVSLGVIASMFYSLLVLPALLSVLPIKVSDRKSIESGFIRSISSLIVSNSQLFYWGVLLCSIAAVLGLLRINLDDNFVKYFDQKYDIRQAAEFGQRNLTGFDSVEYSIGADGPGGIYEPTYLEKLEEFANWYKKHPKVTNVEVFTDIVKRLNMNMNGDDPTYYKIPSNRKLTSQFILLYEMSLPYGLDLNNQLNIDKSASRMVVTFKNVTAKELREADKMASEWLKNNVPRYMHTHGASNSLMFAYISQRNIEQMLIGTVIALVVISLILVIALRSIKYGLVSLISNMVPAFIAFGLWGYVEGQVGLTVSIIGTMALGIVVDDTVHFLSKYLRARREQSMSSPEAIGYAFRNVGQALFITTIVLGLGFSVLAFSDFKVNFDLGILTAIAILAALVIDFLFIPPLLMKLDRSDRAFVNEVYEMAESKV